MAVPSIRAPGGLPKAPARRKDDGASMMRKPEVAFWTFVVMAGLAAGTTMFNVTRGYSAGKRYGRQWKKIRDR